jgi:hypothetical protein
MRRGITLGSTAAEHKMREAQALELQDAYLRKAQEAQGRGNCAGALEWLLAASQTAGNAQAEREAAARGGSRQLADNSVRRAMQNFSGACLVKPKKR